MISFFKYGSKCVIECEYKPMYIQIDKKNNTVEYGNGHIIPYNNLRGNVKDIKIKLSKLDDIVYGSNFIVLSKNILFFHSERHNKVFYFRCEDLGIYDAWGRNTAQMWDGDLDGVYRFCRSNGVKEGYVELKKRTR